jgi:hypothetical protein
MRRNIQRVESSAMDRESLQYIDSKRKGPILLFFCSHAVSHADAAACKGEGIFNREQGM